MLRLAQSTDVPHLTRLMLQLRASTGWRDEQPTGYNAESVHEFLNQRLHDPCSVCYVWQANDGDPAAFCGATLNRLTHPPYVPVLHEWGWSGARRDTVKCWRACTKWAKKRGAEYGYRVTGSAEVHPRRIVESVTWEKL
jgi:hypothetical protein